MLYCLFFFGTDKLLLLIIKGILVFINMHLDFMGGIFLILGNTDVIKIV